MSPPTPSSPVKVSPRASRTPPIKGGEADPPSIPAKPLLPPPRPRKGTVIVEALKTKSTGKTAPNRPPIPSKPSLPPRPPVPSRPPSISRPPPQDTHTSSTSSIGEVLYEGYVRTLPSNLLVKVGASDQVIISHLKKHSEAFFLRFAILRSSQLELYRFKRDTLTQDFYRAIPLRGTVVRLLQDHILPLGFLVDGYVFIAGEPTEQKKWVGRLSAVSTDRPIPRPPSSSPNGGGGGGGENERVIASVQYKLDRTPSLNGFKMSQVVEYLPDIHPDEEASIFHDKYSALTTSLQTRASIKEGYLTLMASNTSWAHNGDVLRYVTVLPGEPFLRVYVNKRDDEPCAKIPLAQAKIKTISMAYCFTVKTEYVWLVGWVVLCACVCVSLPLSLSPSLSLSHFVSLTSSLPISCLTISLFLSLPLSSSLSLSLPLSSSLFLSLLPSPNSNIPSGNNSATSSRSTSPLPSPRNGSSQPHDGFPMSITGGLLTAGNLPPPNTIVDDPEEMGKTTFRTESTQEAQDWVEVLQFTSEAFTPQLDYSRLG